MHPYLFHTGHLYLPTFGALAAIGLMLALALSEKTARLTHVSPEGLWNAGIFAVMSAFVLSRLLLIVTHFPSFLRFPLLLLAVPSLTATGLLLTAMATGAWLRVHRLPLLPSLDAWAPCATLVWAALALGHFAEGSDPGLPTRFPLHVRMPGALTPEHPVALYAALIAALLTGFLYRRLLGGKVHTAALALGLAGLAQFLLTFLRQPGEALGPLDTLQWVALAMMLAGLLTAGLPGLKSSGPFRDRAPLSDL